MNEVKKSKKKTAKKKIKTPEEKRKIEEKKKDKKFGNAIKKYLRMPDLNQLVQKEQILRLDLENMSLIIALYMKTLSFYAREQ